MPKIRVQFPAEKRTALLGTMPVKITGHEAEDAFDAVEEQLSNAVSIDRIPTRPSLNSVEVTRTTGGPALTIQFTGDVSINMLKEVRRAVESELGMTSTEVLVIP